VAVYEKLVEEFPDALGFRGNLALGFSGLTDVYQELGRWEDALDASRKALALFAKLMDDSPDDPHCLPALLEAHFKLGVLLQQVGQQDKAIVERDKVIAQLGKAIELKPDEVTRRYFYALTRAEAGDLTGYRSVCAAMLDRFGRTENPAVAHWVAWTLVLAPDAVKDSDQAVRLAEIAVKSDPKNEVYSDTLGSALYRAGRFGEAIRRLTEFSNDREPATATPSSPIYAWFFLAMAHHRAGHAEEARKWLDKASKWVEQQTKSPSNEGNRTWNRRLTWQLLRREAEALLKGSGSRQAERRRELSGQDHNELSQPVSLRLEWEPDKPRATVQQTLRLAAGYRRTADLAAVVGGRRATLNAGRRDAA
jgi:tetratricopeptide (TPR) repeat protein